MNYTNGFINFLDLSSFNLDEIEEGKKFIIDDFIPGEKYPSKLVMHFLNRVTYQDGSVLFLSNLSPSKMDWKLSLIHI